MSKLKNFSKDVKKEWYKIHWLKREDLYKHTGVIVVSTIILGAMITVMDFLGQWLVNLATAIHF